MQTERVEGPVALPGVTGDVLDEGQWTAGRRDSIELEHQDGAALVLHHLRSEEDLLVHRGTQSDLTTLTTRVPERGAAELLSIDLSARPGPEQAATLEVAVVEFDGTGAPLRTTHHGPGGPHLHLFGADCTHYLVALRLRGVGSVQLRHLRVQSTPAGRCGRSPEPGPSGHCRGRSGCTICMVRWPRGSGPRDAVTSSPWRLGTARSR